MTTRVDLATAIARDLSDPSKKTFTSDYLNDYIDVAMAEVGMWAPLTFQEDLAPIDDQLEYTLQNDIFNGPEEDIKVTRVELWDGSQSPPMFLVWLIPQQGGYVNTSAVGWQVWGGTLYLTNEQELNIDPSIHLIRVWGYRPYARLVNDGDVLGLSYKLEMAVRKRARVEGLRTLNGNRTLFTQWQTRSNNTDVSPAGLMSSLTQAEADWAHTAKQIQVLTGGA